MQPISSSPGAEPKASWLVGFIGLTAVSLFVIGLTGQPNLLDNERRVGAYVLDAIQNGHWMAQRDSVGEVASKPPLFTWLAALGTLAVGHLNRFAIYLPSALATGALGLILLRVGRARFGWTAGLLAALAYVLSPMGDNVVQTARYDGFFALPVALAALAAHRAWTTGRGWTWFWVAAAFATLVKGPLGLLLGGGGLLAAIWEWWARWRQNCRGPHWDRLAAAFLEWRRKFRGPEWSLFILAFWNWHSTWRRKFHGPNWRALAQFVLGIAVFLLICGGWFWLAWREMGQSLIDKQINRELVGHALKGSSSEGIGLKFWEPPWAFLTMFLPWSIPGVMGFWRVVKHPSPDVETRRFERFLLCWFFLGLIVFSVAAHQRSRLIFPLMPAAALLAGRELARWISSWSTRKIWRSTLGVTVAVLAILVVNHQWLMRGRRAVQRTRGLEQVAERIRAEVGAQFPLTYVGRTPSGLYLYPLQFCLNTMRPHVTLDDAAGLLRGTAAAFVVVGKAPDPKEDGGEPPADPFNELKARVGTNAPALHELVRWPEEGQAFIRIVSNHSRLEWPDHTVSQAGALRVELRDARLVRARGGEMTFERGSARGAAVISNQSTNAGYKLRVRIVGQGPEQVGECLLEPGQTWRSESSASADGVPVPKP